jgi:hypothetical protein
MGWIGGKKLRLGDTDFEVKTRSATVAVQSLDDVPIVQSKQILISLGARAVPKSGNRTPFHIEPVEGKLSIKAPKGLKLYKQVELQKMQEVPSIYDNGRYVITLDNSLKTNWLFLR